MSTAEFVWRRPPPAVRPFVAQYYGYRQVGLPPGSHRGLPSPYLTVILTLDDPLVIAAHPDPQAAPGAYEALVGGLHLAPALITHDGRQSGIQLAVRPLAARALLGVPAGELVGTDLDAVDVLGPSVHRVLERLRACGSWAERFDVLDAELRARARAGARAAVPAGSRTRGVAWERRAGA